MGRLHRGYHAHDSYFLKERARSKPGVGNCPAGDDDGVAGEISHVEDDAVFDDDNLNCQCRKCTKKRKQRGTGA